MVKQHKQWWLVLLFFFLRQTKEVDEQQVDDVVRWSVLVRWWHLVKMKSLLLMLYLSSCDKPTGRCLFVIPRSGTYQISTGSCVCKSGVQKCHAGPIYNMMSVCEKGLSSTSPSPYLVTHCPIDNSHSMNGMTKRGNSCAGTCACLPCMEDSREGRQTDTPPSPHVG